ncbi:SUMF1/EgtB/PvdO family nonheme iron enzyme [Saccharicrinis aurantiacus]|uniref:SUMF1/EgtB/PvdO family nonheme iron enzyme n=1 Tax=Saccharicrinis aurantiacus TaxID=1849719 RepID=UPI00094FB68C|nr:SUMF1/EgtB/PvdO family nonheme iron enzyme [Saccharicrinis aurantiacus]
MRLRSILSYATIVLSIAVFTSCSKGGSGNVSSVTGWDYNTPENGGFEHIAGYEQELGPGLKFVEGGTFIMGRVEQDVMYDWDNVPRRVTVPSFYMDESEVRNVDYREYLYWTNRVFVDYPEVYKKALPDTLVWRRSLAYNEPMVENYLRHTAYSEYPVVGVNWLQASDFCAWRTDRVNEKILVDMGVLEMDVNQQGDNNFNTDAYLLGQYDGIAGKNPIEDLDPNKDSRRVRWEDGTLLPRYRLPTEAEWEYAALGLIGNSQEERVTNRRIYPWDGHITRNASKQERGKMMANFVRSRGDYMGVAGDLNDGGDKTVSVLSYYPNDYGLYCMAGNVNEWVADVYRPLSFEDVDEFSPYRGNEFKTKVLDEEGYVVEKDSLGRIRYRMETDKDILDRKNYRTADNRNYQDGDGQTNIATGDWLDSEESTSDMYGAHTGQLGSLVSDRTRVYKGGSWRDRAYWLSPGTRRYLDEREARDDLGFRCAMTRVGSPTGNRKKK